MPVSARACALAGSACLLVFASGCEEDFARGSREARGSGRPIDVGFERPALVAAAAGASGRLLVRFERDVPASLPRGVEIVHRYELVPALAVRADTEGLRALGADARVRGLELDPSGQGCLLEAEPLVGLDRVKRAGFVGQGIAVAVIDSGVDPTHPDLSGRISDEACFCGGGCCPGGGSTELGAGSANDDNGHGTHTAGVIASLGSESPEGGAPGASLVAVKVLDRNLAFAGMSDVIAALDWVGMHHPEVKLINLSLGANTLYDDGQCDVLNGVLSATMDALRASGTLVIASSGNDGSSSQMRAPACVASAISVGAVWDADVGAQNLNCIEPSTAPDQVACYSNASPGTDLLAPGGVITSSWLGGGSMSRSGTSHAAPMVTACAASLLSAEPSLTPDALETLLKTTGRSLVDPKNGLSYPRIDCGAALATLRPTQADADAGSELDGGEVPDAGQVRDASAPRDAGGDLRDATPAAPIDANVAPPPAADATVAVSPPDTRPTGTVSDAAAPPPSDGAPNSDAGRAAHSAAAIPLGRKFGDGCACRAAPMSQTAPPASLSASLLAALAWRSRRRWCPRRGLRKSTARSRCGQRR